MRKKYSSRTRDFNKKYEGDRKNKTKEVTCYECKKSGHIRSECPKLKFKINGAKDRKKAFKVTCDDSSKSKKEEEQEEVANLCFMVLEDENKVPFISNSSCDDYCEYDDVDNNDDDDDDNESSIVSKLMHKYTSLLSRKKIY